MSFKKVKQFRRLSAAEFEIIRPMMRRMKKERIEAAQMVLVDGLSWREVADKFGTTRQSVGDVVTQVWRKWETHQETQLVSDNLVMPPGWERVTLIAPSYVVEVRSQALEILAMMIYRLKKCLSLPAALTFVLGFLNPLHQLLFDCKGIFGCDNLTVF